MRRRYRTAWFLVAVVMAGCTPTRPLIVAHRGASFDAPENTMASFNLAWQQDADLIEGDFHLTGDGFIVAHHDKTMQKTAGIDVAIEDLTLHELRDLDVGSWKGAQWAGERAPTLEEVLAGVPDDKGILIELKSDPRIVPALADVLDRSPVRRAQTTVISFDAETIAATKRAMPDITAYWISTFKDSSEPPGHWRPTVEEIIATAQRVGADGVDLNANLEVIDESFVRAVRHAGLELHVWTVNDLTAARRCAELGVDSITTDRPGWLRAGLARPD